MREFSRANRRNVRLLLASSSVAALLIGVGTPPAYAACTAVPTTGVSNSGTVPGYCVNNEIVTGNISNSRTISTSGISFTNGTLNGSIVDSGILIGGIKIDATSVIDPAATAIAITGSSFSGGISNAGTIQGSNFGILASGSTFTGGITNTGTISAGSAAIFIDGVTTFSGGITNSGTISASSGTAPFNHGEAIRIVVGSTRRRHHQ
jgi:hypothetical protein